jgi:ADP-heptose:LPS heptosyltransferase
MSWYWTKFRLGVLRPRLQLGRLIDDQLEKVNSILLFGYMGMGDAVMFQPTLQAILRKFPHAAIDLVVGSHSQSEALLVRVLAMEGRDFRTIYSVDFKSLSLGERRELNRSIARTGYDMCIATYTTPLQYFTQAIAASRLRVGHTIRAQEWYKPRPNFLFNIARPVYQNVDEREPYRYFRLAMALGIQAHGVLPIPTITVAEEDKEHANQFLNEYALTGKRLVGVHLGVSKAMSWKKWPDTKYAEVLSALDSSNTMFLFLGVSGELPEIEVARQYVHEHSLELTTISNVLTVAAIIERCAVVIGNDSGIGHLSVALGTPTVRLFGMSDHFGCEPFVTGHATIYKDLTCSPCMNLGLIKKGYNLTNCGHRNCLAMISVDEVVKSSKQVLYS